MKIKNTILAKSFSILMMLCFTFMIPQSLGISQFGELTYMISLVTILGVILSFGVKRVSLVATENISANGNRSLLRQLIAKYIFVILLWSIFIFGIILYVDNIINLEKLNVSITVLLIIAFFRAILLVQSEMLKGMHLGGSSILMLQGLPYFILTLLLLLNLNLEILSKLSVPYLLSFVVPVFLGFIIILRRKNEFSNNLNLLPKIKYRQLVSFLITDVILILQFQIHFIIIAETTTWEGVALLVLAYRLAQFSGLSQDVINSTYSGQFTKYFREGDFKKLSDLLGRSAVFSSIFSFVFFLFISVFGQLLLELIYGEKFHEAYVSLVIISGAYLINCSTGAVAAILVISGKTRLIMLSITISVLIGSMCSYIISNEFGFIGGAIGLSVTMVLNNGLMCVLCKKYLNVKTYPTVDNCIYLINAFLYKLESKKFQNKGWFLLEGFFRIVESNLLKTTDKTVVECFGDSHARVFRKLNKNNLNYYFRSTFVGGATSRSLVKFHSSTNAGVKFKNRINKLHKETSLVFLIGEVDCGATFWLKNNKIDDDSLLFIRESICSYIAFLLEQQKKGFNITVISIPLPILNDSESKLNKVSLRRNLPCTQRDVLKLVNFFNLELSDKLQALNVKFVSLDKFLMNSDKKGLNPKLKNKINADHHYNRDIYALKIQDAFEYNGIFTTNHRINDV